MTTIAQQIADFFDNEGTCFQIEGKTFEQAINERGATFSYGAGYRTERYKFHDDSVIVVEDGVWQVEAA